MTGFGRGVTTTTNFQLTIELRSVNHRFLEVHSRFPKDWMEAEMLAKKTISRALSRGKVDVSIHFKELTQSVPTIEVNMDLVQAYEKARQQVAKIAPLPTQWDMAELHALDHVFIQQQEEVALTQVNEAVLTALQEALANLLTMRQAEGELLANVLMEQKQQLQQQIALIEQQSDLAVTKYRERLQERLSMLSSDDYVDERAVVEVAIFADRVDISEELDRLHSHIHQFETTLQSTEAIGRKLDFIMQEMHREINTIGSKNQSTVVSVAVVQAKTILEKMREQVQNVE